MPLLGGALLACRATNDITTVIIQNGAQVKPTPSVARQAIAQQMPRGL